MPHNFEGFDEVREKVQEISLAGSPKVLFVTDRPPPGRSDRVGVLPGSFNPLTMSHIELARQAKKKFDLDEVVLSISKVTTDKEAVIKPSLEERLQILKLCSAEFHYGVAVSSHGLFFEQALGLRECYGSDTRIFFVIGYDKLLQILDPKYYGNKSASLDILFSLARLIVANRGQDPPEHVGDFLRKPENREYARSIDLIALPSPFPLISSTLVREKVHKGESIAGLVPELIERWIVKTGAYKTRRE